MTPADRTALREALANLSRYHAWAKGGPGKWIGPVPSTPPPSGRLWAWVSSLLDALDEQERRWTALPKALKVLGDAERAAYRAGKHDGMSGGGYLEALDDVLAAMRELEADRG